MNFVRVRGGGLSTSRNKPFSAWYQWRSVFGVSLNLVHGEVWKSREHRGKTRLKVSYIPFVLDLRRISMG